MSNLLLPLAAAAVIAQAPASMPVTASGTVVDDAGQPVAGALVQQAGSVTSVFTKADGTFRLLLDKTGQPTLTVSAVGRESATIPVGNGQNLKATLGSVSGFVPSLATPVDVQAQTKAETAPLNTGVNFAYRLRAQSVNQGGAGFSGLANNDYRIGLRYRLNPWLLEGEGAHWQTPVELSGLAREQNPAFSPSTWTFGARVGRLFAINPDLEAAGALGYRWQNTVPNNADIRYTGSGIDFEQSRHAAGAVGTLAWRPNRGPWHVEGSLGLYPLVFGSAKAPGAPFAANFLTDARATVGYEIVRGMRLGVGYQLEDWRGDGSDSSHLFSLNVHYTPGGLPKGDE